MRRRYFRGKPQSLSCTISNGHRTPRRQHPNLTQQRPQLRHLRPLPTQLRLPRHGRRRLRLPHRQLRRLRPLPTQLRLPRHGRRRLRLPHRQLRRLHRPRRRHPPTPTPTPSISVSSLTLVDADTFQPISQFNPIASGTTINLATLPSHNLTIQANTSPATVGSVAFDLVNSGYLNTVNTAPYDLCGTAPCSNLGVGLHSLTTTPYMGPNASGGAGTSMSISFSVIDPTPTPIPHRNSDSRPSGLARRRSDATSHSDTHAAWHIFQCGYGQPRNQRCRWQRNPKLKYWSNQRD